MSEHQQDSQSSDTSGPFVSATRRASTPSGPAFARARSVLLSSIRAKLGGNLRAEIAPEDILNESVLALLAAEGGPVDLDDAALQRRIVVIAENRIRSLARRRDHPATPVGDVPLAAEDASDRALPGDDRMQASEFRATVRAHLAELPLDQRMVIVMRHWLGTSWETIAAVLGRTSVHAAHCLHYRALLALERKLQMERPNREE